MSGDLDQAGASHAPEPLWVPICEVCGRAIYLDDSDTWQHEEDRA